MARSKWVRVSKESPCPICKEPDWCSVSADGSVAKCMRVEEGSFKRKADKNGAAYFLHRLENGRQAEGPAPTALDAEVPPAGLDLLHQVYSALLNRLKLTAPHRDNLRGRGLPDEAIDRNGYRTLPVQGRTRIAKELRERFGDTLLQVPGFVVKEKSGQRYITIAGAAGMLVPVRYLEGRIIALKVRRDDPGNGPKYFYVSSANQGGRGPGSPVHVPLGIAIPAETVRLTEGELKSDVATVLSGIPTISAPGVSNWRPCLAVLKELVCKTVRLAFDMDARDKPQVGRALLACAEAVTAEGLALELEQWDAAHKGIDDLLAAGGKPKVLSGDQAIRTAKATAAAPNFDTWPGAGPFEDAAAAEVIAVAVSGWSQDIAEKFTAAGMPAGWYGVTPKGDQENASREFARGKVVCLFRGNFEEPDRPESERLARLFHRDGAAEVRQRCVGWGFFDRDHTTAEIAALLDNAEVFTPAPEESPDQPREPSERERAVLERIPEVLAAGGSPALFRDRELLATLARLKQDQPAEFAAVRASLKGSGVSVRDLDNAVKPLLRARASQKPPTYNAAGIYRVSEDGCICRERETENGPVVQPLCNFAAHITEVVTRDDGAERTTVFRIDGTLADGRPLPRADVPAAEFADLAWVTTAWHGEAVVYAGAGTRDHLRAAIELLSRERSKRSEYLHTGWREIDNSWVYLHAGGVIGADGPAPDIAVSLPEPLSGFHLPDPPTGSELVDAVRASLRFLDLGPDRLVFPLLASVFRAPLGETDHSLHLAGPTGSFKSETAALCQQHYGPGMDRLHLPGNWASTGNALEGMAFAAKDAMLVVDDFCPAGSTGDVQRYHREADRLFRGQGNRAGRQRMRADATLRPAKPPRGMILSTGEDVPRGQSLRARLLILDVEKGDVDVARLTACQQDAAAGRYAEALAGFIRWLAPDYGAIRQRLRQEMAELRDRVRADGLHTRTPGIVADLLLGLRYLLAFGVDVGVIAAGQQSDLWARGEKALSEAAAEQESHLAAAEPTGYFLRMLAAALASGRAHVASPEGKEPEATPQAWGWREITTGSEQYARGVWQPQGRRVGWVDGPDLYLEPEAAFAEVQELAGRQGESLPIASRTLCKRLKEKGLLACWEQNRGRLTVRRTLEAVNRAVLHLHTDSLSLPTTVQTVQTVQMAGPHEGFPEKLDGPLDGPLDGSAANGRQPSNGTGQKPGENPPFGRFGRSDTRGNGQEVAKSTTNREQEWEIDTV